MGNGSVYWESWCLNEVPVLSQLVLVRGTKWQEIILFLKIPLIGWVQSLVFIIEMGLLIDWFFELTFETLSIAHSFIHSFELRRDNAKFYLKDVHFSFLVGDFLLQNIVFQLQASNLVILWCKAKHEKKRIDETETHTIRYRSLKALIFAWTSAVLSLDSFRSSVWVTASFWGWEWEFKFSWSKPFSTLEKTIIENAQHRMVHLRLSQMAVLLLLIGLEEEPFQRRSEQGWRSIYHHVLHVFEFCCLLFIQLPQSIVRSLSYTKIPNIVRRSSPSEAIDLVQTTAATDCVALGWLAVRVPIVGLEFSTTRVLRGTVSPVLGRRGSVDSGIESTESTGPTWLMTCPSVSSVHLSFAWLTCVWWILRGSCRDERIHNRDTSRSVWRVATEAFAELWHSDPISTRIPTSLETSPCQCVCWWSVRELR